MKRIVLTLGAIALTGALFTTTASAASNVCGPGSPTCTSTTTDSLTSQSVCVIDGATINGGLSVTGDCLLEDSTVHGGLRMDSTGHWLEACGSSISGGVQVSNATCVTLGIGTDDLGEATPECAHTPDAISGSVQISNLSGGLDACFSAAVAAFEAEGSTISGDVKLEDNPDVTVELEGDSITGGAHLKHNGAITVEDNTITGGLHCSHNTPGPNIVSGNTVTGGVDCDD